MERTWSEEDHEPLELFSGSLTQSDMGSDFNGGFGYDSSTESLGEELLRVRSDLGFWFERSMVSFKRRDSV